MTLEQDLIRVSDAFCAARRMSRARLSTIVLKNGRGLDGIAAGKTLTVRTWQASMAWFSANWPDGADWPPDISRPSVTASNEAA